jgi:hypothetical protein
MQRDAIYNALLGQLTTGLLNVPPYDVRVISRGFVHWEAADVQPAIYIAPKKEKGKYVRGTPTLWTIELDLYAYVQWTDSVAQGVTALALVMDGIDFVLSPTGPNGSRNAAMAVNTLGGLAHYCALQGEAEISGGFLNKQQTIARMPVEIVVPG